MRAKRLWMRRWRRSGMASQTRSASSIWCFAGDQFCDVGSPVILLRFTP